MREGDTHLRVAGFENFKQRTYKSRTPSLPLGLAQSLALGSKKGFETPTDRNEKSLVLASSEPPR